MIIAITKHQIETNSTLEYLRKLDQEHRMENWRTAMLQLKGLLYSNRDNATAIHIQVGYIAYRKQI